MLPRLALTMGDPAGIGPEIILKALLHKELWQSCLPLVVGDELVLRDAMERCGLSQQVRVIDQPEDADERPGVVNCLALRCLSAGEYSPGVLSAACGDAAFRYIRRAITLALEGRVGGVVTAPISKEALHLAGHAFAGHTEIFATMTHCSRYAMLLVSDRLRVIHCTTHVSMQNACKGLTRQRVSQVIALGSEALAALGIPDGRIAVAGLNPHCSEGGLFGREEEACILPAVEEMRRAGLRVEGPIPADTVFVKALAGQYDLVVAMYHDQGHIPMKLLGFQMNADQGMSGMQGVNVTAGLPILRTSVDHGTAFDIAGKGIAHPGSMLEAILLAARMAPSYKK